MGLDADSDASERDSLSRSPSPAGSAEMTADSAAESWLFESSSDEDEAAPRGGGGGWPRMSSAGRGAGRPHSGRSTASEDGFDGEAFLQSRTHPQTGILDTYTDTAARQERLRRRAVLKHIDEMVGAVASRQRALAVVQSELAESERKSQHLESRIQAAQSELEQLRAADSKTRLQQATRKLARLQVEYEAQQDITIDLDARLEEAERQLQQAQTEQAKFSELAEQLNRAEAQARREQVVLGSAR